MNLLEVFSQNPNPEAPVDVLLPPEALAQKAQDFIAQFKKTIRDIPGFYHRLADQYLSDIPGEANSIPYHDISFRRKHFIYSVRNNIVDYNRIGLHISRFPPENRPQEWVEVVSLRVHRHHEGSIEPYGDISYLRMSLIGEDPEIYSNTPKAVEKVEEFLKRMK